MEKIAIFVEGQTELVFVYNYLLAKYNYQDLSITTEKVYMDFSTEPLDFVFPCANPTVEFFIYDAGSDEAVLKRLIQRLPFLRKSNFTKIIGLRDMYGDKYKKVAKQSIINNDIIQNFIDGANETIQDECEDPSNVHFCFAIMEIEAWLLNLYYVFEHINEQLTEKFISEQLNWDIKNECAECKFFHPAKEISKLYWAVGLQYGKHINDIKAIMKELSKSDFDWLYQSGKSASFKNFVDILAA